MNNSTSAKVTIQTNEGITFGLELASPVSRFLAWALDLAVVTALIALVETVLVFLHLLDSDLFQAVAILAYFVFSIGYGLLLEWAWRGQTLGKRLVRLRVVDASGLKLHFSQVLVRNLLRFVDSLPICYFVGGVVMLANRKVQRLGDIAGNTLVVRYPRISQPDLTEVLAGKYNSFRDYPHLEARLRQKVGAEEASVAYQAILRRDQMDPKLRVELLEELAQHLRSICDFPEEATYRLTSERYVRNCVDSIYRSRNLST